MQKYIYLSVSKVRAGSIRVFVIHQTLTWISRSLTSVCDHSYQYVYTRGLTASQHNIFDSEKSANVSCAPDGIQARVTDVIKSWVWHTTNLATLPPTISSSVMFRGVLFTRTLLTRTTSANTKYTYLSYVITSGVMDWLSGWSVELEIQRSKVRIPSGAQEKLSVSKSKRLCWLAVGVPSPCVYTHTYERPCTHVKDPAVHVRVWWTMETWK